MNVHEEIEHIITQNAVVLFMKGTPDEPLCGFSARVVEILHSLNVDCAVVDVIAQPAMRDGVKAFSDWPTLPQLFVQGTFIGGCDIVTEMYKTGEVQKLFQTSESPVA